MIRLLPLVLISSLVAWMAVDAVAGVPPEILSAIVDDEPNPLPKSATLEEQRIGVPVVPREAFLGRTPPTGAVTCPAEYEPCEGLLMRWGSYNSVLTELIVGLTTQDPDAIAYLLVTGSSQQTSATSTLTTAGADMSQVSFITYSANTVWIRDYGPRFIFEDGNRAMVDHTYNRPRPLDNAFTDFVSALWGEPQYDIPLTHGGGNFHLFTNRDAFMTSLILDENAGLSEQDVKDLYLQYQNLELTIYPRIPSYIDSTGHIDMWMMPLEDNAVVISRWTSGPAQTITDDATADLISRGYTVHRVGAWNSGGTHYTYTNAVVMNDLMFISSFGGSYASQDAQALAVYQAAVPNHQVIQVYSGSIIQASGAIHCVVMHVPAYPSGPQPPVAMNASVSTAVSVPLAITLLATDDRLPDPPAAMTYIVTNLPAHGDLTDPGSGLISSVPHTLAAGGNLVDYQPTLGYAGPDSFQFKANDGGTPPEGGDSNIATVSITVGGPEWDPVANNMNWSTAVSTPGDITLSASDPNGDPLTYIIESLPAAGSLIDPANGPITFVPYTIAAGANVVNYTPPAGQPLQESFDFSVADATAGSNVATVSVTVGGPQWDPVAYDVQWGTGLSLPTDVTLSAADPNGDPLTYVIESLPAAGNLSEPGLGQVTTVPHTLAGGGNVVTYHPPYGQALQVAFDFSAHDATAGSNVATVTVDVGAPHAVFNFLLDTDPGWLTEGAWSFGQPTGTGSHAGDPTAGNTGMSVYGYNLNGDYANSMPVYYLTTPALDCTYVVNAELRFYRWLGVEAAFDDATVQVSTDGAAWTTVWENGGTTYDESSWSAHSYDISSMADGAATVYVRWGMGPTDSSNAYHGWNLDDIVIWGLDTTPVPPPCEVLTYTPGDVNLDGSENGLDVSTFVAMLLNPGGGWTAEQLCAADFTADAIIDPADIGPFVNALLTP